MRSEADFKKWLRRLTLGVSATAPLVLSACGRSESHSFEFAPNASVILSKDAGATDSGVFDAGCLTYAVLNMEECGSVRTSDCVEHRYDFTMPVDGGACLGECQSSFPGQPFHTCERTNTSQTICWYLCAIGRLVAGLEARSSGADLLGAELANMAAHEAGAALAFTQLASELERHGMHPSFARRARRAAREEVRHTRLVGGLARARGGRISVTAPCDTERTLEALALENATEGCVRETLGAVVGLHQARHASDPSIRRVMAEVSEDELGHAAWSHALAASLESRLPLAARRRTRELREQALATVAETLTSHVPGALHATLGLLDAERLQTLTAALR